MNKASEINHTETIMGAMESKPDPSEPASNTIKDIQTSAIDIIFLFI